MPQEITNNIEDMRKVVLVTLGSLGDLHPYMAVARVLRNHGDSVTIVTHPNYEELVESAGFAFIPMRPGPDDFGPVDLWMKQANDSLRGTEFIVRKLILPYVEDNYRVLMEATRECDLIISHLLTFAAPLVAEKRGIPWVSLVLQPSAMFSAFDPPLLGSYRLFAGLKLLGPSFHKMVFTVLSRSTRNLFLPVFALREQEGLPLIKENQLIRYFSPYRTLALFPEHFALPQSDWPKNLCQVGFPLYGKTETAKLPDQLLKFIADGSAPFVFTLGSAIVQMENNFFEVAYEAVKRTGIRAIFLVGDQPKNVPPEAALNLQVFISGYESFAALFPLCKAVVHQCGIGTTSQALSAGLPQILVPFAHDQPDNANRVKTLGMGITLPAKKLTVERLVSAITEITNNESYSRKALSLAQLFDNGNFDRNVTDALSDFGKPDYPATSAN
jgi:rhamnosyltransferase subunit B